MPVRPNGPPPVAEFVVFVMPHVAAPVAEQIVGVMFTHEIADPIEEELHAAVPVHRVDQPAARVVCKPLLAFPCDTLRQTLVCIDVKYLTSSIKTRLALQQQFQVQPPITNKGRNCGPCLLLKPIHSKLQNFLQITRTAIPDELRFSGAYPDPILVVTLNVDIGRPLGCGTIYLDSPARVVDIDNLHTIRVLPNVIALGCIPTLQRSY
ncbi:hypothetical protein [Burkholderia sp. BCC1208]|uniref:hypothetical protein n=1 Tax=Burkholderia sp. BCC1208 TaxID=2676292 RepID=UPI001FC8210B|nr:hypothetical protein [Burkholderia sp. BCC1208]